MLDSSSNDSSTLEELKNLNYKIMGIFVFLNLLLLYTLSNNGRCCSLNITKSYVTINQQKSERFYNPSACQRKIIFPNEAVPDQSLLDPQEDQAADQSVWAILLQQKQRANNARVQVIISDKEAVLAEAEDEEVDVIAAARGRNRLWLTS